jgi:uncharacterized protein YukE/predicted nucleic-acid-binding Zn-ribbon protein
MYLDGDSTRTIAVKLNKDGYRTKDGTNFTQTTIARILRNDKYMGTQTYGKTEYWKTPTGKNIYKTREQEEWIVYKDAHEAIIDKALFAKVQKLVRDNTIVPTKGRKRSHAFTGLIRCGKCGNMLSFDAQIRATGEKKVYLKPCAKFIFALGEKCRNRSRPLPEVYEFTKHKLWSEVRPAIMYMNSEFAKKDLKDVVSNQKVKIAGLVKQRNQLNTQIENLLDMQLMNGMSDRLMQKQNQLEQQLKSLDADIELLKANDEGDSTSAFAEIFMQMSKDFLDLNLMALQNHSEADLNKFLKRYIAYISHTAGQELVIQYTQEVETAMQIYKERMQNRDVETQPC